MRKLRPAELLRNTEEQQKAVTPADAFPTVLSQDLPKQEGDNFPLNSGRDVGWRDPL